MEHIEPERELPKESFGTKLEDEERKEEVSGGEDGWIEREREREGESSIHLSDALFFPYSLCITICRAKHDRTLLSSCPFTSVRNRLIRRVLGT